MIYLSKIKIIGMITILIRFVLDISTKTAYSLCAKERFFESGTHIYKILTMTWYNMNIL